MFFVFHRWNFSDCSKVSSGREAWCGWLKTTHSFRWSLQHCGTQSQSWAVCDCSKKFVQRLIVYNNGCAYFTLAKQNIFGSLLSRIMFFVVLPQECITSDWSNSYVSSLLTITKWCIVRQTNTSLCKLKWDKHLSLRILAKYIYCALVITVKH